MFHSGVHQWPGFGHKWPRVKSSCKMTRKHQWAAQCLSPKRDSNNSCKPKPEYYPLIYLIYELNSCIVLFASWIPHFKEAVHPQPRWMAPASEADKTKLLRHVFHVKGLSEDGECPYHHLGDGKTLTHHAHEIPCRSQGTPKWRNPVRQTKVSSVSSGYLLIFGKGITHL